MGSLLGRRLSDPETKRIVLSQIEATMDGDLLDVAEASNQARNILWGAAVVALRAANGAPGGNCTRTSGGVAAGRRFRAPVAVADETSAGDCFCGGRAGGRALTDDLVGATQRVAPSAGATLGTN